MISERALLGWKLGTWCPAPLTVANVRSPLYTSVYPPTCDTKKENNVKLLEFNVIMFHSFTIST